MVIAEPGGTSTQAGTSYQNSIATLNIGKMLNPILASGAKRIATVRVESPTHVDDIVITYIDGSVHYIQAKEAISGARGKTSTWASVIKDFENQFNSNDFKIGIDSIYLILGNSDENLETFQAITNRASVHLNYTDWKNSLKEKHEPLFQHTKSFLAKELQENEEKLWQFFASIVLEKISRKDIDMDQHRYMPESNQSAELLFTSIVGKVNLQSKDRHSYTKENLKEWLEENNIKIADSISLVKLRESMYSCNSIMRHQNNTLAKINHHLPRDTSKEISNWLLDMENQNSIGILLDQAGSGKTVVMKEVLIELERNNQDVLAIKADQQLTNISNLENVKAALNLPMDLIKIASTFSLENGLVVIIDQLDALSLSMAHDESALNLTLDLIFRLHTIPKIRVLISCRNFDYESDPRFRNLENSKKFHLAKFSDKDIENVMSKISFNYQYLSSESKELLKTPLHLNLFLMAYDIADSKSRLQLNQFSNLQELYQIVWQSVIMKKKKQAPPEQERAQVLFTITRLMNQNQKITVRRSSITQIEGGKLISALDWLLSEGIIIEEKENLSFFHQTFFDYCYARNFLDQEDSLYQMLLNSPQGLFQRPQMTHVLAYLRNGEDESVYAKELQSLLSSDELRYHLKDHLYHWLSSIPNLKEFEIVLIEQLFSDENLQIKFLKTSATNFGWFEYWKNSDILNSFILSKDHEKQIIAFNYLSTMMTLQPKEVTEFIIPLYSKYPSLNELIERLMLQNKQWDSVEAREFLEIIMNRIELQNFQAPYLVFSWKELANFDSEIACNMILHFMWEVLNKYKKEKIKFNNLNVLSSIHSPSLIRALNEIQPFYISEALPTIFDKSLLYFIEKFLPWYIEVAKITTEFSDTTETKFLQDELFRNWYDKAVVDFNYIIQKALIDALIKLAKHDPYNFNKSITILSNQPYESLQFVVAHVYSQVPEEYNSEIIQFLLGDLRRLLIGHECYESRHLIKSLIPYAKSSEMETLQMTLLNHFPFRPLTLRGYKIEERSEDEIKFLKSYISDYDKNQFIILKSFPLELLNYNVKKRFMELERKYKNLIIKDSPRRIEEYTIISPIAEHSVEKFTDSQWISAIQKYNQASRFRGKRVGSDETISPLLQKSVVKEPQRFISIFKKINFELDLNYTLAFLNGLAEADITDESLFEIISSFHNSEVKIVQRTIANIIEKKASKDIPKQIINLLESYMYTDTNEEYIYQDDPFTGYYSSVRGSAMQALMEIFTENENEKWKILDFASKSSDIYLMAGCIYELKYMIAIDKEFALNLFENTVTGSHQLYFTNETISFLQSILYELNERVLGHLQILIDSTDIKIQEKAAGLVALAIMIPGSSQNENTEKQLINLFENSLNGSVAKRKGITKVISINILAYPSPIVINALYQLMNDEDQEILQQFIDFTFQIKTKRLKLTPFITSTIHELVKSKASEFGSYVLGDILYEYAIKDPTWTLSMINIWLDNLYNNKLSYINSNIDQVIRIVIKIYNFPTSTKIIKKEAMDTFDGIMKSFTRNVQHLLTEWDRR